MKHTTLRRWRNRLPHWEIENGTYFITIRCAGSLPPTIQQKIKELQTSLDGIKAQDEDFAELQRQIFLTTEKYLDQGQGFAPFKNSECCRALFTHLEKFEIGWQLSDWVIMPNHIHFVVLDEGSPFSLGEAIKRFKGRTARTCNLILGRRGSFWQRDWFDRWVRNESEFKKVQQYIAMNPVKAGLSAKPEAYPWWRGNNRSGEL